MAHGVFKKNKQQLSELKAMRDEQRSPKRTFNRQKDIQQLRQTLRVEVLSAAS